MLNKLSIAFTTILTAAAVLAPPSPLHAESCTHVLVPYLTTFGCVLPANATDHYVHIYVSPFATAAIQDLWTQVFVFTEDAGLLGISRTITGLYGGAYGSSGRALPTGLNQFPAYFTFSN
jgi:hypothetical protein